MFMLNQEQSDNPQEATKNDPSELAKSLNDIDSSTNYSGTQWGTDMGLKPMNCPGHCLLYASSSVSYRDLPIRYAEFSSLHRYKVNFINRIGLLLTKTQYVETKPQVLLQASLDSANSTKTTPISSVHKHNFNQKSHPP